MKRTIAVLILAVLPACGHSPVAPVEYLYQGLGGPELQAACYADGGLYFTSWTAGRGFERSPLVDPVGSTWTDVCCTAVDHGFHWNVGGERFGEQSVAVRFGEGSCLSD